MTPLSIQVPFPVFQGRDGQPLENGYVWIGAPNLNPQTNPVAVYFDAALTIPAPQPLRTLNGYVSRAGTPAQIYVDGVNFSILVQDSKGSMVYNFPDGTGISPDACGVTYSPPFTGAVPYPVCEKLEQSVSVKDFGAVGDGVADDTTAIENAINAAFNNTLLFPSGNYKITQEISITLNSAQIELQFNTGATLTSTAAPSSPTAESGAIQFNGSANSSLKIVGGVFVGASTSRNFQSVIESIGVERVEFDSITVTGGGRAGVRVLWADWLIATNCSSSYNYYAGLLFSGCYHTNVVGGQYSYNGSDAPLYGYGITAGTTESYYPSTRDNKDVLITGVKAYYNLRKGIDVHNGTNVVITGNTVLGFGYGGIYAVNEGTDKEVNDIKISDNIVENDTAWFNALGMPPNFIYPMQLGGFGNSVAQGTYSVTGNTIKRCDQDSRRSAIFFFTNTSAIPIESILISGNTIYDANFIAPIFIDANSGTYRPKSIEISENSIIGNPTDAFIRVNGGEIANISNNNFVGDSVYGVAIGAWVTYGSICENASKGTISTSFISSVNRHQAHNNLENGVAVVAVSSESTYDDYTKLSGVGYYYATNGASSSSIDVATVTVGGDVSNSALIYVKIVAVTFNAGAAEVFHGWATAGDSGPTFTGSTTTQLLACVSTLTAPVLSWSGTGTTRTLAVSLPTTFTAYHITVDTCGWRCPITFL